MENRKSGNSAKSEKPEKFESEKNELKFLLKFAQKHKNQNLDENRQKNAKNRKKR